jgi:O-antigen/teichoic acid export membrane protein
VSLAAKALSIFQRDLFLFVTNLATGIIVARSLGPAALGLWVILQLVPSYAEALGRFKFDLAAVYVLGKGVYRREDVLLSINLLALASSVLVGGLIWWQFEWLTATLFGEASGEVAAPLMLLLLQIPLQFFYLNYAYIHIADEDVAVYNRMVLVRALTNTALAVVLLLIVGLGLWSVVIAAVVSSACGLLYGWVKLNRSGFRQPRISWRLLKELSGYGFHLYTVGVLGQFDVYGTRSIVVLFLAPAQVAFYSLAQGAGLILDRMPQALNTILLPRISRSNSDESVLLAANAFRITAIFLLISGSLLAVLADVVVTVLYGDGYATAATALRIILPGVVVAGAASTLVQYFQASGRAALIPRIQLGPLLVQLVAAFTLTNAWGLEGAALALCIGMVLRGILEIIVFLRVGQSGMASLIPRVADIRQSVTLVRSWLARVFTTRQPQAD